MKFDQEINYLVGGNLSYLPFTEPFNENIITFLNELSLNLLKNNKYRAFSDVISFGYWCRTSNINKLYKKIDLTRKVGRGVIFHIAPANVPINFAFSMVFGLLTGNTNIIRVSDKNFKQVDIICDEISKILIIDKYKNISPFIHIVRYKKNSNITEYFSLLCNVRIIWGGDDTINYIKTIKSKPRCIDICFSDRYSICILNSDLILKQSIKELEDVNNKLYNDIILYDQNACSSPHLIIWNGSNSNILKARKILWDSFNDFLNKKLFTKIVNNVDKYSKICDICISEPDIIVEFRIKKHITTLFVDKINNVDITKFKGNNGFLLEIVDNEYNILMDIVNEKYQTITYFGVDKDKVFNLVVNNNINAIDRIVPIGSALNIDIYWDGYDLISYLTRTIDCK